MVTKYQISISSSGCCGRCRQSGLRRQRQLKPAAAYSFIQLIHSYTLCWPAVTPLSPPSKTRVCTLQPLCCSLRCRLIVRVLRLCHAHVGYFAAPLKVTTTLSAIASRAGPKNRPNKFFNRLIKSIVIDYFIALY